MTGGGGGAFATGGGAFATGGGGGAFATGGGGVAFDGADLVAICRGAIAFAGGDAGFSAINGGAIGAGRGGGANGVARAAGWVGVGALTTRWVTFDVGEAGIGFAACCSRRAFGRDVGGRRFRRGDDAAVGPRRDAPGARSRTTSTGRSPGMRSLRPAPGYCPSCRSRTSRFTSTAGWPLPPMTTVDCAQLSVVAIVDRTSAPSRAAVERNLVLLAICPQDSQNDMTRSNSIKCFAAVPFAHRAVRHNNSGGYSATTG